MTFANSLDLDQARQNVGPDLDQSVWHSDGIPETQVLISINLFDTQMVFLKLRWYSWKNFLK